MELLLRGVCDVQKNQLPQKRVRDFWGLLFAGFHAHTPSLYWRFFAEVAHAHTPEAPCFSLSLYFHQSRVLSRDRKEKAAPPEYCNKFPAMMWNWLLLKIQPRRNRPKVKYARGIVGILFCSSRQLGGMFCSHYPCAPRSWSGEAFHSRAVFWPNFWLRSWKQFAWKKAEEPLFAVQHKVLLNKSLQNKILSLCFKQLKSNLTFCLVFFQMLLFLLLDWFSLHDTLVIVHMAVCQWNVWLANKHVSFAEQEKHAQWKIGFAWHGEFSTCDSPTRAWAHF